MASIPYFRHRASSEFRKITDAFLGRKGLPFAEIISAERITEVFRYDKQSIADLYGFRWNSETDIGHIKTSLNLNHVRCKSPAMVRRELWATMLAYNLIRTTAAGAALVHCKLPRQISFTSTCQYILSSWMLISTERLDEDELAEQLACVLKQIASCDVANRPGRLERASPPLA